MRWLADENLNNDILRAIFRKRPAFDIVRVQDVGLLGADDESVLAWAGEHRRVLLTHDVTTITDHAYGRTLRGEPMPGVIEVASRAPIAWMVEDLILIDECSLDDEWDGRVVYLPLR